MIDPGALGTLLIGLRSLEDTDEVLTHHRRARTRGTEPSPRRPFGLRVALRQAFQPSPNERTAGSRP